jgi:hypothetical protein
VAHNICHWKNKYDAKTKVEWIPKAGTPLLFDPDIEAVTPIVPGSHYQKGNTVWAVPSSTMGAYHDADLIRRLAFAATANEYEAAHRGLSEADYPRQALDGITWPR